MGILYIVAETVEQATEIAIKETGIVQQTANFCIYEDCEGNTVVQDNLNTQLKECLTVK